MNTSTRISTEKENTSFHSLPMPGMLGAEALEQAEDQAAQHGAGDRADAADHRGGEGLEADRESP